MTFPSEMVPFQGTFLHFFGGGGVSPTNLLNQRRAEEPVVVFMALVVRVEEKAWHHERGRQQLPGCIFGDWPIGEKLDLANFAKSWFS